MKILYNAVVGININTEANERILNNIIEKCKEYLYFITYRATIIRVIVFDTIFRSKRNNT